jgi:phosphoglycolate phosphatase
MLFDLDGTIIDPIDGIGRSFNFALVSKGFKALSLTEQAKYIGPPLDESFRIITKSTDEALITELIVKYRERFSEIGYSENHLYPGISEVLKTIYDMNVPMALCTSKRIDYAEQILKLHGLFDLFRFISAGDIGTKKWQQIELLLSSNKINSKSIMVGDRAVDLTSAHKNGLTSVGVLWGYGSREELAAESPLFLIENNKELIGIAESF